MELLIDYLVHYKNRDVFLEKEKRTILDLGRTLFETKNKFPIENQRYIQVHLLADKSTDFKIIDSIKSQISSSRLHLYYRTNHLESCLLDEGTWLGELVTNRFYKYYTTS